MKVKEILEASEKLKEELEGAKRKETVLGEKVEKTEK